MKHASTGTNHAILTKRVKLQHQNKPILNLKVIQIVNFEKTSTKFIEIFIPYNSFIGKNRKGNHLSGYQL